MIALLAMTLVAPAVSQEILWTYQFGATSNDTAHYVAVDGMGDIYVYGETSGALPGQTGAGGSDVFLVKFDHAGRSRLWTRQFGTVADDWAQPGGIAVDGLGSVYVVGRTAGALPGQTNLGETDAFVVKFDSGGSLLWTRQFGTPAVDYAGGAAVDGMGNVYVVGETGGTLPGQTRIGGDDIYVVKSDTTGGTLWTCQFGTRLNECLEDVAVDGTGNVYVVGGTAGTLSGQTSSGMWDSIVVKFDSDGTLLWAEQFGSSQHDFINSVMLDGVGNLYVVGWTDGGLPGQSSSGSTDAFLVRLDNAGAAAWTRQFGTPSVDYAVSLAKDGLGNLHVAGWTGGALHGQTHLGGTDAFVVKSDGEGNVIWTHQFGTSADDRAGDIASDGLGDLYIVGSVGDALQGQIWAGEHDASVIELR